MRYKERSIFSSFKTFEKLTALFVCIHGKPDSRAKDKIILCGKEVPFHLYHSNSDNFLDKKDNLIKKGLTKNNAIGRIEKFCLLLNKSHSK